MRDYLNLVFQLQRSATIDAQLQNQVFTKKQKQKPIVERIVEAISYLAKQNLALREHCSASYGLCAVVLVPRGLLPGLLLDNSLHTQ